MVPSRDCRVLMNGGLPSLCTHSPPPCNLCECDATFFLTYLWIVGSCIIFVGGKTVRGRQHEQGISILPKCPAVTST